MTAFDGLRNADMPEPRAPRPPAAVNAAWLAGTVIVAVVLSELAAWWLLDMEHLRWIGVAP